MNADMDNFLLWLFCVAAMFAAGSREMLVLFIVLSTFWTAFKCAQASIQQMLHTRDDYRR